MISTSSIYFFILSDNNDIFPDKKRMLSLKDDGLLNNNRLIKKIVQKIIYITGFFSIYKLGARRYMYPHTEYGTQVKFIWTVLPVY